MKELEEVFREARQLAYEQLRVLTRVIGQKDSIYICPNCGKDTLMHTWTDSYCTNCTYKSNMEGCSLDREIYTSPGDDDSFYLYRGYKIYNG